MVSVEWLDARLLRSWIVEAAAVVTPAMSIDNSIVDIWPVRDQVMLSSNRRAPETLSQHTEATMRQATARHLISIQFDRLENLWRRIWSLRGVGEIVHQTSF
jgi:hypothetical protein